MKTGLMQCPWVQAQPLFPQLLTKALELVRGCTCRSTSGCPGCIQSMSCDEYNAVLHKDAGIAILEITLAAETEYAERMEKQVCCTFPILLTSCPADITCWDAQSARRVFLGVLQALQAMPRSDLQSLPVMLEWMVLMQMQGQEAEVEGGFLPE